MPGVGVARAAPVDDDVLSVGIDRRPEEEDDAVEDRLHLRLVRARQQLVGDLRRVLRAGDLRGVQSAADVDERAPLARELARLGVGEAGRVREALLISRSLSSCARFAGDEMIAAVHVLPYDVLPTVISLTRLLAAASFLK